MNYYLNRINEVIEGIEELNRSAMIKAEERLNSLAKPIGSLGKLEDIAVQLSGITGKIKNKVEKKAIIIMCADNGVVEEGVASGPQSLTVAQTINFTRGLTGVAVLAEKNNSDLIVVDVGINSDEKIQSVKERKIRKSTDNIAKGPAMTYEECLRAIVVGIDMVEEAKKSGYDLIGVGEMGIGNTTTSSAVLSVITGCEVEKVVGKGAGLTKDAFEKKKKVIRDAIKINNPDKNNIIDVLSKVGGFDLAAMTGVFLGAAFYKIPVVIDGFISVVAALAAFKINSLAKEYFIPSHKSWEVGYNIAIENMHLEPMLDLNMRLGEGSGCPIAFSIVEYSCAIMNNMATFDEAEIDDSYLEEVREKENYIV
ncbi:Nicotinate-nucleotide-dimethylbenzimidazolephosphoribosyltransferase [Clostridium bornimense]|uniref:Nicotinate-nucleotide--dimethylbenzimidazole phosphoribosyltransferase n=1 Tax=Clostridium bornimense TaxID=1216932 RepID=W6S1X3_9CLOT|nr:nicotinate-nucleotide--dimethylbenzimidazole phosphoribosyltransferase [Clostridium bornimense]CDM68312.1 Nicotinate-nucleotide-dimethylbenzimidazolephosphoribosyltransferase [Clostridium bornimense]